VKTIHNYPAAIAGSDKISFFNRAAIQIRNLVVQGAALV
jgi:hypothetical protein